MTLHRSLLTVLLLLPTTLLAAEPPEELNATALVAGARTVSEDGEPLDTAVELFDGTAERMWEPNKTTPTVSFILELAEPFDLTRAEVVNSSNERVYPGISTKKLRLEQGASPKGPWKPVTEVTLKKGTAPQKVAFAPLKAARYLRVTLLENHGNQEWWSLAELSVFGRRSTPREKIDFTGAWDTQYGNMRLTQKGQRITGCYGDEGASTFEGTHEGPVFFGTYQEGESRGTIAFALNAEGNISGVWGTDLNAKGGTRRWDGKKAAPKITCKDVVKGLGEELKEKGRLVLRSILFDFNKDIIRPESVPVLQALADAMKADGEAKYIIEGHTDNKGGEAFNQTLSEKRAASVRKWLMEHGVAGERLIAKGFGQGRPSMPNDSEAGRAANRRVEVAIQQ